MAQGGMARKMLIGISTVLVLIIVMAATAVWLLQDGARLKAAVEDLVSVATERTLRINGDFDVTLGRIVSVHATDIEWLNPAWSSKPYLLKLRELDVAVDLWSLIQQPILVTHVQASDGELLFEWTDKQFNWAMGPEEPNAGSPHNPLPLLLDQAQLDNIQLHFVHPGLTEELTIELQQARQQQDASGYLVLDVASVFDGRAVAITGRIGTFPQLTVAGNIDYDLTMTGPNATITARGAFANLARLEEPALDFRFAAPETAVLFDLLNLPEITHGPADFAVNVHSDGAGIAATAQGTVGEFELQASGKVDKPGTLEGLALDIASSGPDAGTLARLAGIDGFPDRAYTLKARVNSAAQGLVIKDLEYAMQGLRLSASGTVDRFPELQDFDVELSLDGENLADFNGLAAKLQLPELPFSIKGTLRDTDADENDDLDATIRLGQLAATIKGKVTAEPGFTGSTFDYSVKAANLQQVSSLAGVKLTHPLELNADGTALIGKNSITVPRLNATIGPYQLTVDGSIPVGVPGSTLKLGLRLQGDDFSAFANLLDTGSTIKAPPLPFDIAAGIQVTDDQIITDSRSLQLGRSRFVIQSITRTGGPAPRIDVDLDASGASLAELLQGQGLEGVPAEAFKLKSKIQLSESSGIQISDLDFSLPDARLEGKLSSDWPKHPGDIQFALQASGKNLAAALPEIPAYKPQNVAFNVQMNGEYSGDKISIGAGKARIGTAAIDISGLLRLAPELGAQGIHIQASGANLVDLGTVGDRALPALPFQLSASMDGTANRIRADDLSLQVGASNLRGKFDFNGTGRPLINADLRSSLVNLDEFIQAPGAAEQAAPGKPSGDDRLLSDDPLPLAWLNDFDGNVRLEVTEVITRNRKLHDLVADASLSNGELVARKIELRSTDGNLTAELNVRPLQGKTEVSAKLSATDVIIAFRKMSKADYEKLPREKIDAALTARGNSTAELGASLNGFVWMRSSGGQMPSAQLGAFLGDFLSEVLGTINPFVKKQDYLTVDCEGVYLEAENGILTTAPTVVFLSDQILITSSGNIDLATEKIDFGVETTPARGLSISISELLNPFIKIGGTLGNPVMVLDAKGTALQGGAAVATGGLSLLAKGLWTRMTSSGDICGKVEEAARKIRQKRDPDNVPG